ncbi:NAD(P)-dependent oxidoreductase [Actinobacteria bacterium YIM 96077]|uniref:NAD(P)-dependent oxidoreductase n=1 Tax=Phytoactinopolyspora halophila TaxID=1981511 RepID=A0A329QYL4_9ACTN|nr:NAD(P)-dependent oxidoreductase [Phytoactinopolyspora halophila]AYY13414.1 NAD(P)-dependent oxidoreductase [Actinobacteria bacterium YIM 96077]RAW17351.1 NAD(P)-dependent oxidoreductase [Phytoactinopolyspora halophila]
MTEHVLITGAAGMIGRAAVRHFRSSGVTTTGLVLDDPGDVDVDRLVMGDVRDRQVLDKALEDVDAVVHLAALATPDSGMADEVFGVNTQATFTVLDAAGERGIRRATIASSINALGYRYGPHVVHPEYLPLDEALPTHAADAYSLSKHVDEATAAAMHRRHGMDVVALRFPMVGGFGEQDSLDARLPPAFDQLASEPGTGASDLWLYLEERDAARALALALTPAEPGAHVAFVAAPVTSVPYRTRDLLDAYYPDVPLRDGLAGRSAPVDLTRARTLLGFEAAHVAPMDVRDLPAGITTPASWPHRPARTGDR